MGACNTEAKEQLVFIHFDFLVLLRTEFDKF